MNQDEKDMVDEDITKLQEALRPVLSQGVHPAAAMYIGAALMTTVGKQSQWESERVMAYLLAVYESDLVPTSTVLH